MEDAIVSYHGSIQGRAFFRELRDLASFLLKHSSEFVIIHFQQDSDKFESYLKGELIRMLRLIFGKMLVTQKDRLEWFKTNKVTMCDLRTHKRNALVVFREEIFQDYPTPKSNLSKEEVQKLASEIPNKQDESKEGGKKGKAEDESVTRAKLYLKERGFFNNKSFIREYVIKTDKSSVLIEAMEESYNDLEYRQFRVNYYCFSAVKKFKLGYFFKPPTIYLLDKKQFHKDHGVLTHLVECIDQNFDVNIGNPNFQNQEA